jgi:hypothetical protein
LGFEIWCFEEVEMKRTVLTLFMILLVCSLQTFAQEIYRWVDERGTVHFTDDLSLVPEKYRDTARKERPAQVRSAPPPQEPGKMEADRFDPPPDRRDRMGRGEEWWRARAKERHDKLLDARKNYESAHAALKAKEKELDDSKFKPKSLKRKLKVEIKGLEEKVKEWEKKKEEFTHMLESVLPKEAEEYEADPNWVKIKD